MEGIVVVFFLDKYLGQEFWEDGIVVVILNMFVELGLKFMVIFFGEVMLEDDL